MLGKLINTYHVYTASMSTALNGSSMLECFEHSNAIEIRKRNNVRSLPGTATHIYLYIILILKTLKIGITGVGASVVSPNYWLPFNVTTSCAYFSLTLNFPNSY